MAALNASVPNAPLVDPATGEVTPAWRGFLLALYNRTGAGTGTSSAGIAAAIAAETVSRTAADTALGLALSNEATARTVADTAETAARIAADDVETAARIAADGAETTARTVADGNLQGEITALSGASSFALLTQANRLLFDHSGNPIWTE